MRGARISTASIFLILLTLLIPGCSDSKKHDCNTQGHEWVQGKAGDMRCKHCGIYQDAKDKK